jgi:hypothetical protein
MAPPAVPAGAADAFHVSHPSRSTIVAWLDEVGLDIVDLVDWKGTGNIFIQTTARAL